MQALSRAPRRGRAFRTDRSLPGDSCGRIIGGEALSNPAQTHQHYMVPALFGLRAEGPAVDWDEGRAEVLPFHALIVWALR